MTTVSWKTLAAGLVLSVLIFRWIPAKERQRVVMSVFDSPVGYYGLKLLKAKKPHRGYPRKKMISGHLEIVVLPLLESNYCYLIVDTQRLTAIAVDPADESVVLKHLQNRGLDLIAILCTHKHWDHSGGNAGLAATYPKVQIFGHKVDFTKDSLVQQSYQGINYFVEDGSEFQIDRTWFQVIQTPGHTKGSVLYLLDTQKSIKEAENVDAQAVFGWNESAPMLFTGDTLFLGGCGRMFEGNALDLHTMFRKLLKTICPDTYIFPGHEYTLENLKFTRGLDPSLMAIELAYKNAQSCLNLNIPTVPGTWKDELETNVYILLLNQLNVSLSNGVEREAKKSGFFDLLEKETKQIAPDFPTNVFKEILHLGLARKLKDHF